MSVARIAARSPAPNSSNSIATENGSCRLEQAALQILRRGLRSRRAGKIVCCNVSHWVGSRKNSETLIVSMSRSSPSSCGCLSSERMNVSVPSSSTRLRTKVSSRRRICGAL